MDTQLCEFTVRHAIVQLQCVNCTACELCLSETVKSLVWARSRAPLPLPKHAGAIARAYWDKAATRASPWSHAQLPWETPGDSLQGQGDQECESKRFLPQSLLATS